MRWIIRAKTYFRWMGILIRYVIALMLAPIAKRIAFYQDLWIISERGTDARDNSYHLFRYIRTYHPGIHIAYIIAQDSPDYPKVAALGETIPYCSFRHYLSIAAAKLKISTHIMGFTPDMYFFMKLDRLGIVRGPVAFIQHGIIRNDMPLLHVSVTQPDLFVTSVQPERDFILQVFSQPADSVQLLGLCRFDALHKNTVPSKSILLMPTWRIDLQHATRSEFLASQYYSVYQSLLASPRLQELLEHYGYTLRFFPHYEIQRFLDTFSTNQANVQILGMADTDVQQLLLEADILITDYSSVFSDFAYMEKPMIFFQFDSDRFWKTHYQKGYFDYEKDGYGAVVKNQDALLTELETILKSGVQLEPRYLDRIERSFVLRDQKNCQRNFEAIQTLLGKEAGNGKG